MKAHKINSHALAELLAQENPEDGSIDQWLNDIRENPDLYLSDHVHACEQAGVLPLSEVAWRRLCLSR